MSKKLPKVFTAGNLRDLKWKLCVAVASSALAELNEPYVQLRFVVDNAATNQTVRHRCQLCCALTSDGKQEEHSVDLSIAEFQVRAMFVHARSLARTRRCWS